MISKKYIVVSLLLLATTAILPAQNSRRLDLGNAGHLPPYVNLVEIAQSGIAEAAKAWGQNDDITVVTVRSVTS